MQFLPSLSAWIHLWRDWQTSLSFTRAKMKTVFVFEISEAINWCHSSAKGWEQFQSGDLMSQWTTSSIRLFWLYRWPLDPHSLIILFYWLISIIHSIVKCWFTVTVSSVSAISMTFAYPKGLKRDFNKGNLFVHIFVQRLQSYFSSFNSYCIWRTSYPKMPSGYRI